MILLLLILNIELQQRIHIRKEEQHADYVRENTKRWTGDIKDFRECIR